MEKINLFRNGKTQAISSQKPINIFGNNNNFNKLNLPLFNNNQGNKTNHKENKKQGENNNININNNGNKKDINSEISIKKPKNNILRESININIFPINDFNFESNSAIDNKNGMININNKRPNSFSKKNNNININNNLNLNTQNKTQIKKGNNYINDIIIENNLHNKDNISINIDYNKTKDNNNNITENNNKKPIIREKNFLSKSIIFIEEKNKENKVKNREKEILDLKKRRENEKNKAEIMDQLKCYICMDKLKKPRICVFCHRPACDNCIKKWLDKKHHCGFCRKKINYNETIEIPIISDIADFFIKNINNDCQKKKFDDNGNYNKKKNYDSNFGNSYSEIIKHKLQQDEDICPKHESNYEYFCYQCNEKYCAKCLSILDNSSKIHENHLVVSLEQLEKNNNKINEAMEEFKKLEKTNLEIDNLIKLYELKLRELEIEKNNFIDEIDFIKEEKNAKVNDILFNLSSNYTNMKNKINEISNSIYTTPMALKNIITNKDYGQGNKIYEHLYNLNEYALENNFIDLPEKNLFIETIISNPIEIVVTNEGNIKSNNNEQIENLIPKYEMKITFENIENNIRLSIKLKKKSINNNLDNEKIFCFIIFRNKKYGCEFIKMKQELGNYPDEIQLYSNISINVFFSFQDEKNRIFYKLYFMVYKS